MPSINDWARKCAKRICDHEFNKPGSIERVAAIISLSAEPLEKLLRDSKRIHRKYCPRSKEKAGGMSPDQLCNCGADVWNKQVDSVVNG